MAGIHKYGTKTTINAEVRDMNIDSDDNVDNAIKALALTRYQRAAITRLENKYGPVQAMREGGAGRVIFASFEYLKDVIVQWNGKCDYSLSETCIEPDDYVGRRRVIHHYSEEELDGFEIEGYDEDEDDDDKCEIRYSYRSDDSQ